MLCFHMQAHVNFQHNQEHDQAATSAERSVTDNETFEVIIECSQRTLEQLAQSIYTKQINLDMENAEEILLIGDYLQVTI
jgi:hypothetical protein